MHKMIAVLVAAVLLAMVVPNTQATSHTETIEAEYSTALGYWIEGVSGRGQRVCPSGCDNPDPDIPPIGGVGLYPEETYSNVDVMPSDDVFGANGAISVCLWNPSVGNTNCSHESIVGSGVGCGTQSALDAPFEAERATVFVNNLVVTADLDVRGGTTGSVVADFS